MAKKFAASAFLLLLLSVFTLSLNPLAANATELPTTTTSQPAAVVAGEQLEKPIVQERAPAKAHTSFSVTSAATTSGTFLLHNYVYVLLFSTMVGCLGYIIRYREVL